MRKQDRKLVVRRETLRTITATDLTRAAGGDYAETGKAMCTAAALPPPKA
jgi:hypothetical protein